jgi:eukaryotic-like serine/threonine-protein kinase
MTSERWHEIQRVLERVLEAEAEERPRVLAESCAGDPRLQRDAEEFLRYEQAAARAFPVTDWRSSQEEPAPAPRPDPERISRYRILHRIGEGGMGIVYLAERDDGAYRRRVAIKVMRETLAGEWTDRFRTELQILSGLTHPYIAALIDGGTEDGRPYCVMEYVEGLPLTEYCDRNALSDRERLRLFCRVLEAVSHAHRHLVIHRDLKPANILVTGGGSDGAATPKLLDFGLAKEFHTDPAGAQATTTLAGLTPGYASPEQVRGERLSTATDVYSLGVLLYELLAGSRPYGDCEGSPIETVYAICERDPIPPSRIPGKQHLAGDIENIILRALRKEPQSRYAGADELRRDIENFLAGFPVRASRATAPYRAAKFLRRHRWGAAASIAALVAAGAAAAALWQENRRAEARFNDVRELAHTVVFELHDAIQNLPGSTAARKLLVQRALEYLERLEAASGSRRDLRHELAAAYRKIGDVQGSPVQPNLADPEGAMASYESARRLLAHLLGQNAGDVRALEEATLATNGLAYIYRQRGDLPTYRRLSADVVELHWRIARLNPASRKYAARALRRESETSVALNELDRALPALEKASRAYDEASAGDPADTAVMREQARIHADLAYCRQERKELDAALREYREALRIDELCLAAAPADTQIRLRLSWDYSDIGWVQGRLGNWKEAARMSERAVGMQEQLAAADTRDSRARAELAKSLKTVGYIYKDAGRPEQAAQRFRRAGEILQQLLAHDPEDDEARSEFAVTCVAAGYVRMNQASALARAAPGRAKIVFADARTYFERARDAFRLVKTIREADRRCVADIPLRIDQCKRGVAATDAP